MTETGPLAGVRVLELARILAGPWAGQVLADLGADVVKVESPDGDDTRGWGPPFVEAADGGDLDAAYYHSCNRGKRAIALDFTMENDRATALRLADHADVVIENFRVGGLKKFGLDAASLRHRNPALIVCSITGFGQTGPYADRAGYDFIIQGMSGIMSVTGEADGQPMRMGVAYSDIFTGLYSVIAIQAALRERERTGKGAHIDMALLDTQTSLLQAHAMNYLVSGQTPKRTGAAHPNIVPYQVVPVRDGHIILAVGNDAQFARACAILEMAELADDPRFRTNADRVRHREVLMPLIMERTAAWSGADLMSALREHGVPYGPINTVPEVLEDPQIVHRGVRIDLPLPDTRTGTVPSLRNPILMDGAPHVSSRPSPGLDEHRAEVLSDPAWGGGAS